MFQRAMWMAGVAMAVSWCALGRAEEKGKPLPKGFGKTHSLTKVLPAETLAALKERSRAIEVGGTTTGIKDMAALGQILEDMGLEPKPVETEGVTTAYNVSVTVQGLNPVNVVVTMDQNFVYTSLWCGTIKDPAAVKPEALLTMMAFGGPMGSYGYLGSESRGMLTFAAIESKIATRAALLKRVRGVVEIVGLTISHWGDIGFEAPAQ
jgi:hypothetical protein